MAQEGKNMWKNLARSKKFTEKETTDEYQLFLRKYSL